MISSAVSNHLQVGTVVIFATARFAARGARYKSVIRGWRVGGHILLDRPADEHGVLASLQENQECTIRFVHNGLAVAFTSHIIEWDTRRANPHLRISWPVSAETSSFRRFERVEVRFPCRVLCDKREIEGEVRDISIGGCGMELESPCDVGSSVNLSFELPNGSVIHHLDATVRMCRPVEQQFMVGCEFTSEKNVAQSDIGFFITSMRALLRKESPPRGDTRILALEHNSAFGHRLLVLFERKGCALTVVDNAMDAFHRMRLFAPVAVALCRDPTDLDALIICSTIRKHSEYSHVPIFVYGRLDPAFAGRATEAGAAAYITDAPDLARNVVNTIIAAL